MQNADILSDALEYALDRNGEVISPIAVINAHYRDKYTYFLQSSNACYNLKSTLEGVFNTILIRATRQIDETLGFVAQAVQHSTADAKILIAQENIHGAQGLEKTLRKAFPSLQSLSKFKCRIMTLDAQEGDKAALARWTEKAAIHKVKHNRGEFWSCPGLFSWDRPDPGSRLLLNHLPARLEGMGADLGCGNGFLSEHLAKKEGVTELYALDADSRAVECCKRNLEERNVSIPFHVLWRDATTEHPDIPPLDWVVMNPPFHTQQNEDRELGQKFCLSALRMLRLGGSVYLVANRHMPYEQILEGAAVLADTDGFKVLSKRKDNR